MMIIIGRRWWGGGGTGRTGDGAGDDERVDLDLDYLPPAVSSLFIVVNGLECARAH